MFETNVDIPSGFTFMCGLPAMYFFLMKEKTTLVSETHRKQSITTLREQFEDKTCV